MFAALATILVRSLCRVRFGLINMNSALDCYEVPAHLQLKDTQNNVWINLVLSSINYADFVLSCLHFLYSKCCSKELIALVSLRMPHIANLLALF